MGLIELRDRTLPAPRREELPPAPGLRSMLGPGVILAGLAIGSGEFVLWPRLTAEWGFVLFWACLVGATMQFFLNMEIERYTLATGESAVTGFVRLSSWFGPIFLACSTLPWIWPGWAQGAGTLLSWQIGGPPTLYSIIGLVGCGAILSLSPVVYRTVERLQVVLVALIFTLVIALAAIVVRGDSLAAFAAGFAHVGRIPEGVDLRMLLGALAFAGAGGAANLAQSNYVKDKGYGMGQWIGRVTSPFTGREEAESEVGAVFEDSPEARERWSLWWRRANVEHFFSFYLLTVFSLSLFCLLTHALIGAGGEVGDGLQFIADQGTALETRFGPATRHMLIWTGFVVFLTTELAIIDAVARVSADLVKLSFLRGSAEWTTSRCYFAVVWSLVGFGILVLLAGMTQPLVLLVLSAALNAVVMFLYSGLLLWMNWRFFEPPLRPSAVRVAALVGAFLFFGGFSAITIVDELGKAFGN